MSATYDEIEAAFDNGDLDTTYPPSVYEAFCDIQEIDIDDLTHYYRKYSDEIASNYIGHFQTVRELVEFKLENEEIELPSWIAVDYETSWNADLIHSYDESDGHYFLKH